MKRPRITIASGPTREMIDPVRFLSNLSTGLMGYELAACARRLRYPVHLISGPTFLNKPPKMRVISVVTAREMKRALVQVWQKTDILLMPAAVCDYTPARFSSQKIRRVKHQAIRFTRTEDILRAMGKRKGHRIVVGFSLETEDWLRNARRKLKSKHLDLIVVNWYSKENQPFGPGRASMMLLDSEDEKTPLKCVTKREAAQAILKAVLAKYEKKRAAK